MPSHDQIFKLEESQQVCPIDGSRLSVVGNKFIRSEIRYIPAEVSVVNIYQEIYECRTCKKEGPETTLPATGIAYCNQLFNWERKI